MISSTIPNAFAKGRIQHFERGWLSSNNVLLLGRKETVLVDSGYVAHAPQTLNLIQSVLGARLLDRLVNTHLHSDHCGGNASLQSAYPNLHTTIAPGEAPFVMPWQPEFLSHESTGQACTPFRYDSLFELNTNIELGDWSWQVLPAPGHDPHAVMLWCDSEGILISADALWERGFGIVFPELQGQHAFAQVRSTLELVEQLQPSLVLPGHGSAFTDVQTALQQARDRLQRFEASPGSHHQHAIKALLKFLLLDWRQCTWQHLCLWVEQAQIIHDAMTYGIERGYAPKPQQTPENWPSTTEHQAWLATALNQLIAQGQLTVIQGMITDS